MRNRGILAIVIALPMIVGASEEQPRLPGWMTGCWEQADGDRWVEECWGAPRGGTMMGSGRSGRGDRLSEWESTQIILMPKVEGEGATAKMAFFASPGGAGRTMFAWQPTAGEGVTFVNAAHDYPQRVHYRREGDVLIAEISLADGSKARSWRYRRK